MAMTLRLPSELKAEADALAARLGISVNALVAVALRDYLDGRRTARPFEPAVEPPAAPEVKRRELEALQDLLAAPDALPRSRFTPPKRPTDPCPCGSVDFNGHAMTWEHCHGRSPA